MIQLITGIFENAEFGKCHRRLCLLPYFCRMIWINTRTPKPFFKIGLLGISEDQNRTCWKRRVSIIFGTLKFSILTSWNFEALRLWSFEIWNLWNFESLKLWIFETWKLRDFETDFEKLKLWDLVFLEHWNFEKYLVPVIDDRVIHYLIDD